MNTTLKALFLCLVAGPGWLAAAEGAADFDAREWGVVVLSHGEADLVTTESGLHSGPRSPGLHLQSSQIRVDPAELPAIALEPVIYVTSRDGKAFDLRVTLPNGGLSDAEPAGERSERSVLWKGVRPIPEEEGDAPDPLSGSPLLIGPYPSRDEVMARLDQNDSQRLRYGGAIRRFLFYEGPTRLKSPVRISQDGAPGELFAENTSEYAIHDFHICVQVVLDSFNSAVAYGGLADLAPGAKAAVTLAAPERFPCITPLGFSAKENAAFEEFWRDKITPEEGFAGGPPQAQPKQGDYRLFYRLDEKAADTISRLEFDPKPKRLTRALFVLEK